VQFDFSGEYLLYDFPLFLIEDFRLRFHAKCPIPAGWKLCLRDKDLNELYDLKADPLEAHNLYSDPQYVSMISRCAGEIHRWHESAHDRLKI
jgi:Domain of unknown function (DUF4976)